MVWILSDAQCDRVVVRTAAKKYFVAYHAGRPELELD